jgi:hypothetical protein
MYKEALFSKIKVTAYKWNNTLFKVVCVYHVIRSFEMQSTVDYPGNGWGECHG